jgi:hypothetical protein
VFWIIIAVLLINRNDRRFKADRVAEAQAAEVIAQERNLDLSQGGIDKLIESSENLPSVAMSLVGANS